MSARRKGVRSGLTKFPLILFLPVLSTGVCRCRHFGCLALHIREHSILASSNMRISVTSPFVYQTVHNACIRVRSVDGISIGRMNGRFVVAFSFASCLALPSCPWREHARESERMASSLELPPLEIRNLLLVSLKS